MAIRFEDETPTQQPKSKIRFEEPAVTPARIPGAPEVYAEETETLTGPQRVKKVGKAGALGAALGAVTPEIMRVGGAALRSVPQVAPYAGAVQAMGEASRGVGGRLVQAIGGGLGGLVGETGGQVVEAKGGSTAAAEAARFAGGVGGQLAVDAGVKAVRSTAGPLLSAVLNKLQPGAGTFARTLGMYGTEEAPVAGGLTLNQQQREFIARKLQAIRGGERDRGLIERTQKEIYGVLRSAADDALSQADARARQSFDEATRLLSSAEAATGEVRAGFVQQINRIQSQFEQNAIALENTARQTAQLIREQADRNANQILERGRAQGPAMLAGAKAEADAIRQRADEEVQQLTRAANARMARLRDVSQRLRTTGGQRVATAQREVRAVGEQATPTQLGEQLRTGFESVVSRLKATREANAQKYKGEAFGAALEKEKAGQFAEDTPAFKAAMQAVDREIKNPETGLQATIQPVREQLRKIVNELKPFKVVTNEEGQEVIVREKASFERLEQLRRFLRDRASGLPAEGYDAIGQQQAGRLADLVENIQRDFSPGFGKFLEQYRVDSQPLNQFKNKLGQAMVGRQEFDMNQFVSDPAALAGQAFKTASTVKQVVDILGREQSEKLARSYFADVMRSGRADSVAKALDDSRDWISTFPALKTELERLAGTAAVAERTAARRETLAGRLRTEMGATAKDLAKRASERPQAAAKEAAGIEARAAKEAEKVLPAAEEEAAKVQAAGAKQAAEQEKAIRQQIQDAATAIEGRKKEVGKEAEARIGEIGKQAEEAAKAKRAEGEVALAGGEQMRELLLGKDVKSTARVEQIIDRASKAGGAEELQAVVDALRDSPQAVEQFSVAVSNYLADAAEKSLTGARRTAESLFKNLRGSGLVKPEQEAQILKELDDIMVTPADLKVKLGMIRTVMRATIMQGLRQGVGVPLRGGEQEKQG